MTKRSRNLYVPNAGKPFKLSRSRLENFINCPRCFYLDRRLGVEPPSGPPFNLNSAVDALLKKEFDVYRRRGKPHPLMQAYGVDAVPYAHPELDIWRENFKGVQYHHPATNLLLTGAIDDLWITPAGEVIVVDYKATSKDGEITLDDEWKTAYKRQMEIYQWLLRRNGLKVSDLGYFVYSNGLREAENFGDCLRFKTVLLPYAGNDKWVEDAVRRAHACLNANEIPKPAPGCEFCEYLKDAAAVREAENSAENAGKTRR